MGLEPPGWGREPAERCDGDCEACARQDCEERGENCTEIEYCKGCPRKKWCAREIKEGDAE